MSDTSVFFRIFRHYHIIAAILSAVSHFGLFCILFHILFIEWIHKHMFRLDGCEIISVSAVPFPVRSVSFGAGQLLQRFQICNVDEPVMDK